MSAHALLASEQTLYRQTRSSKKMFFKPLPTPTQPWESVGMDFIVQLPKTKRGHDAIIVFVRLADFG
jgi:hypothetical protein